MRLSERYIYEIQSGGYEYEYNFPLMNAFLKTLVDKINQLQETENQTLFMQKKKE